MPDPSYDWAALYQKHRDAMYGVAYEVLRGSGRWDLAADAVQEAVVSLMKAPPADPPRSWEALLVVTAKRRALDIVRSVAVVRSVEYSEEQVPSGFAPDEDDALGRLEKMTRARAAIARLDTQEHYVLAQYVVLDRPRDDVAAELAVTPGRISQINTKVLSKINDAVKGEG